MFHIWIWGRGQKPFVRVGLGLLFLDEKEHSLHEARKIIQVYACGWITKRPSVGARKILVGLTPF